MAEIIMNLSSKMSGQRENKSGRLICLVSIFAALLAGDTQAELITVQNPGFEAQVLSEGATASPITGWTGLGTVYAMNPTSMQFLSGNAAEGQNMAMLETGSVMFQTLSATVQYGTYTVNFDVGQRSDSIVFLSTFALRGGGDSLTADSGSMPSPGGSSFATAEFIYTVSPANSNGSLIGNNLRLDFFSHVGKFAVDNIQVNFTAAVPEPGAASLVGLVMFAVAFVTRRKRDSF